MKYTITDAGRQAAANAEAGGYVLEIAKFAVADGVGYDPDPAVAAFRGTEQHRQDIYFASKGDDSQMNFILRMGLEVGDFNFGEVAIILKDGTFFAIGTLDLPYRKTKTTTTKAGNIIEIEAAVKLVGSDPTIHFETVVYSRLAEIQSINSLISPRESMESNGYLSRTKDNKGNSIIAFKGGDTTWVFPTHLLLVNEAFVESGGPTRINSAQVKKPALPVVLGEYIVHFTTGNLAGQVRVVNDIQAGYFTWTDATVAAPTAGSTFRLLRTGDVPDVIKRIDDLIDHGQVYQAVRLRDVHTFNVSGTDFNASTPQPFNGEQNVSMTLELRTRIAAGTYTKIQVDHKGMAVGGTTLDVGDIPALPASKVTSGVFDPARLGVGVANYDTCLFGNQEWRNFRQEMDRHGRRPMIWAGPTTPETIYAMFADDELYKPGTLVAYRGTGSRVVYVGNGDVVVNFETNTTLMKIAPGAWVMIGNIALG